MDASVQHLRPAVKHAVAPGPDSTRGQAMTHATTLITDLLRTVLWLLRHGVFVIGFTGRQQAGVDRVIVHVAASSHLHVLLPECAWRERRQEGALTVYTWFAIRHGIRIEWEEVCA